jgi:hypothetical protein
MQHRVSLIEVIDAGIPLRPEDAVAIVRDVCRQYAAGELRGIPNATVIRLTPDGQILVEGPVSRDQAPVPAAAALLTDLLPGFDTPHGFRVPGGLRLLLARATRSIDLPPFADVEDLSAALDRFAAPDLVDAVRGLFADWSSRQVSSAVSEPPTGEITISDVRRARRATGLPLEDVAQAAGVPAAKLRELEWGYVRNWHADEQGRDELRRYARATGLDEDLVVSIAWPLIEGNVVLAAADAVDTPITWALVPAAPRALAPMSAGKTPRRMIGGYRWPLALASSMLLVAGLVTTTGLDRAALQGVEARQQRDAVDWPAPPPAPPARRANPALAIPPPLVEEGATADVRPASLVRPAAPRPQGPKARNRRPVQQPHRSFFHRELFRIVIR